MFFKKSQDKTYKRVSYSENIHSSLFYLEFKATVVTCTGLTYGCPSIQLVMDGFKESYSSVLKYWLLEDSGKTWSSSSVVYTNGYPRSKSMVTQTALVELNWFKKQQRVSMIKEVLRRRGYDRGGI